MKKDIIIRNLERLIYSDYEGEKERIEPMSEWKWKKLYKMAREYGVGAWVADGIKYYDDDFFLQMSPTLRQQFMDLPTDKNPENLDKFQLYIDRMGSPLSRLRPNSLRAYANELMKTIQNIEE